jgi:hypothetical protein
MERLASKNKNLDEPDEQFFSQYFLLIQEGQVVCGKSIDNSCTKQNHNQNPK